MYSQHGLVANVLVTEGDMSISLVDLFDFEVASFIGWPAQDHFSFRSN